MKKLIFILIFISGLFLTPRVAEAQFKFGIKAGYNASKLSTNLDSIKTSINSGFHVGLFARIGKKLYLQPEVYYTLSGSVFENDSKLNTGNWKQKVNMHTLDIPVLVGFKIVGTDKLNWRINAGPVASFVLGTKLKDLNANEQIVKLKEPDLSEVNWSVQVGTGFDIWMVTLDLRYQIGLNKVIKEFVDANTTIYPVNSSKNIFVVSAGFKIL